MLEALSQKELSAELLDLIQGWMLSQDSSVGKEKALDAVLDRMFKENSRPEPGTYQSLSRLHERIGPSRAGTPAKKRMLRKNTLFRVAAAVIPLLVLGGVLWFIGKPSSDPAPIVATTETVPEITMMETIPDDRGTVALPDGSTVRLVGDTQMTVAENFAENRSVRLSGEAFFSVAKHAERPFTVTTDRLTVTVLGTEFNLKAYPETNETVVSLASGLVEVTNENGSTVLAPMEQLVYNKESGASVVAEFTPEQIDRWRFGEQALDDVSLSEALRTIGDFYGKEVVIEEGLPHDPGVTTVLKESSTAESVLEAIRLMSDAFVYTIVEDTLYIGKK